MKWEKIKHQPETLLELVNELGTRGVGDRFNINKDTVNYWLKKYDYEYNPSEHKWEKPEIKIKDPDIEFSDTYTVETDDGKEIELSKEELKQIYYDYCELNLTQEETAIKNGIIKDDLKVILRDFGIIHDSLPVPDDEILEKEPEEVIEQILINKKRKIKEMKPAEELRHLRSVAKKFYQEDYHTNKILESLEDKLPTINIQVSDRDIEKEEREMVITLADWHYGKKVLSSQLLGDNSYNKHIFKERIEKYKNKILESIEKQNPKKIHIVNLGDIADDPQSKTYPNQLYNQDVVGEEQILECSQYVTEFVLGIYKEYNVDFDLIFMKGNHSDSILNADILIGGIVKKMLSGYDINVDAEKKDFKIIKSMGNNIILNHGDNLRSGKNTRENDILNIIHSLNLQGKNTYFINGHKHHEDGEGINYERKQVPSLVGSDTYSQNRLNVNARPAQMFFYSEKDGLTKRQKVYFD